MKKGFTLLEMIVVVIILGILGTLGTGYYSRTVEKTRSAEASMAFGQIRKLAAAYYQVNNTLTGLDQNIVNVGGGGDQYPTACRPSHFFMVSDWDVQPTSLMIEFCRCPCGGANGKGGATRYGGSFINMNINWPGEIESVNGMSPVYR